MRARISLFVSLLTIVLFSSPPVRAEQEASIIGIVTDETKAVLPGATVTATNLDTGIQAVAAANEQGEYRLVNLPAGRYKLEATLTGFSSVVIPSVELLVGQHAVVPFALKVATVSEAVTVVVDAPLVDTASSQISGNVDRRQMESLPLQGRNWMELSKLVKGITANDVTNSPGVNLDDYFQLNLDGQQITQKIANSGFGQPRFSREAIAEFQIVTNLFDVTQGRSAGIQVQAISRAGTNRLQGSVYGYFRDDALNAKDKVANRVLPYQNQQIGGALGGPIVQDRLHYFASYEHEREPGTLVTSPAFLPGQSFSLPYRNTQKSLLARVDGSPTSRDRLTVRGSRWDWSNPFVLGAGGHPSNASVQTKAATNLFGTWSRVLGASAVQEVKVGYNNFQWDNLPQPALAGTMQYDFPGLTLGAPFNVPQRFRQHNVESRYDLTWTRGRHELKIGGEYLHISNTGDWFIQQTGRMVLLSVPPDLAARIPQEAWNEPSRWNLAGLDGIVQRFDRNFHPGDWRIDVPRPTVALWIGDTWRITPHLTLNYGLRWDDDFGVASPPNVVTNSIPIDNGRVRGDFGYRDDIYDHRDVAPRAGVVWNVGGRNSLTIRGGTGIYYSTPVSNMTFSPQIYSQMITASFLNDGRPGFILDPARGVDSYDEALAAAPPQSPRVISPEFRNPYTWQSTIGFQKQLDVATGVEADVTHYTGYNDIRTIDPNLFYDPATGYSRNPALGRPNPAYTQLAYFVSEGRRDRTDLSMALHRRLKNRLQAGATYTLMFAMHDDGTIGYTAPGANNQFDYLDGEYATSVDLQRHTVRAWALYQLPWGFATSVSYFYGSGTRYATSISGAPWGKPGTNRLNVLPSGAPGPVIAIPEEVRDHYHGAATIEPGAVIPRNALAGLPLHKVDLRLTWDVRLAWRAKATLIGEVYNLFDHANYGSYNGVLSANAATLANFGKPQQNAGNAYVPRQAQLAFRVSF